VSLPGQFVHHPVAVVSAPLIAMGADGSGSMVYGMPPVRIRRECGCCRRWMDDSCFRPLARACRPCEDRWWRRDATKPPTEREGGGAANQNRTVAALESFSNGPLACARSPTREPDVNRPCTDREGENVDKLKQFLDSGSMAGTRFDTEKPLKTQSSRAATVPGPLNPPTGATHEKENRPNDAP
jgi:hypothetical protein